MKRIKYLVATAIWSLLLMGCSNSNYVVPDSPPTELYTDAQQKLQSGNFQGAITQLEALDSRYPFSAYSSQAQFDLIYAYYKSANLSMALVSIDRFMRLNPTHPNIDYMLYLRGLTDMALDDSALQGLFGIDRSDRDPIYALAAFRDFTQLIENYPSSQYATDSQKRLLYLKNRLAKHELDIARYYTKRGAHVAVVNRIEQMMQNYPDTQATRDALPLMKNSYERLQLNEQADQVAKLIAANPVGGE